MLDWIPESFLNPLGLAIVVAMVVGLILAVVRKNDQNGAEAEWTPFNIPIGRYKLTTGLALVVAALVAAAYGVPQIEATRQADRIAILESTIEDRDGSIKDLQGEKEQLEEKAKTLEKQLNTAELERDAANLLVGQRDQKIFELNGTIEEKDTTIADRDEEIAYLERSAESQKRAHETKTTELESELEATRVALRSAEQLARDIASAANEARLSARQRADLERIRGDIDAINGAMTYLKVREAALLRVGDRTPATTYEIYAPYLQGDASDTRGIGLFRFFSESFEIESMRSRAELEQILPEVGAALCDVVGAFVVSGVGLDDALARIDSLQKYEGLGQQLTVLAEFEYVRQQLQALAVEAKVYVRGYADGERSGWQRELPNNVSPTIAVHAMSLPNAASPLRDWRFEAMTEARRVADASGHYTNAELPNLRGVATREVLEILGTTCGLPGQNADVIEAGLGILDGRLDPEYLGEDRKSRVFVSIDLR
jgi:hypothetical protein